MDINFRYAVESDAGLVLHFIRELAKYEKMLDEVTVYKDKFNVEFKSGVTVDVDE